MSIQSAINDASDVLADEAASAADKLAAQDALDQANLAYSEALSLKAIYDNSGVASEALDIADALLTAQIVLVEAESAYALDASAENLAALTQARNTLQSAKDALSAWSVYLPAHETSQTAQALDAAIQQAALDAARRRRYSTLNTVLSSWTATAAERARLNC